MVYSERVRNAMVIAYQAHAKQTDRGGYPYIAHPLHLAEQCQTESETIVALLHDVLEDARGMDEDVRRCTTDDEYDAVKLLSRNLCEQYTYMEYIENLAGNPLAKKIKLLDLKHNLDASRTDIPESLRRRYENALLVLDK